MVGGSTKQHDSPVNDYSTPNGHSQRPHGVIKNRVGHDLRHFSLTRVQVVVNHGGEAVFTGRQNSGQNIRGTEA